jgi:hypothetical protein
MQDWNSEDRRMIISFIKKVCTRCIPIAQWIKHQIPTLEVKGGLGQLNSGELPVTPYKLGMSEVVPLEDA